jgi:hypothetical protein
MIAFEVKVRDYKFKWEVFGFYIALKEGMRVI